VYRFYVSPIPMRITSCASHWGLYYFPTGGDLSVVVALKFRDKGDILSVVYFPNPTV